MDAERSSRLFLALCVSVIVGQMSIVVPNYRRLTGPTIEDLVDVEIVPSIVPLPMKHCFIPVQA